VSLVFLAILNTFCFVRNCILNHKPLVFSVVWVFEAARWATTARLPLPSTTAVRTKRPRTHWNGRVLRSSTLHCDIRRAEPSNSE